MGRCSRFVLVADERPLIGPEDTMVEARLLDSAGRRRSPASMPGYHLGRIPRNKGQRYPADPPRTEEIVAVMRHSGETSTATACAR